MGTDLTNRFVTQKRDLRVDTDGMCYVDVLGFGAGLQNEPRRKQGSEEHLIAIVKEKLLQDSRDLSRVAKHTWMLKYLQEVLRECTSAETRAPVPNPTP